MLNTTGTNISVAKVAKIRPPTTARPSGAFCSPPSPRPSAMGAMPMIMASAVIRTGRKRPTRGYNGIAQNLKPLAREADDQNAVRRGNAHAHDGAREGRHRQRGVRAEQH